jgi:hypothetical protein
MRPQQPKLPSSADGDTVRDEISRNLPQLDTAGKHPRDKNATGQTTTVSEFARIGIFLRCLC